MAVYDEKVLYDCKVLYIGTACPTETKKGVEALQQPLKARYSTDLKQVEGVDCHIAVLPDVLQIQYVSEPDQILHFPIAGLTICAAVRCVTSHNPSTGESGTRFVPVNSLLDTDGAFSVHPAIFSAIFRRQQGRKVLECHSFICTCTRDALHLVNAMQTAYQSLKEAGLTRVWEESRYVVAQNGTAGYAAGTQSQQQTVHVVTAGGGGQAGTTLTEDRYLLHKTEGMTIDEALEVNAGSGVETTNVVVSDNTTNQQAFIEYAAPPQVINQPEPKPSAIHIPYKVSLPPPPQQQQIIIEPFIEQQEAPPPLPPVIIKEAVYSVPQLPSPQPIIIEQPSLMQRRVPFYPHPNTVVVSPPSHNITRVGPPPQQQMIVQPPPPAPAPIPIQGYGAAAAQQNSVVMARRITTQPHLPTRQRMISRHISPPVTAYRQSRPAVVRRSYLRTRSASPDGSGRYARSDGYWMSRVSRRYRYQPKWAHREVHDDYAYGRRAYPGAYAIPPRDFRMHENQFINERGFARSLQGEQRISRHSVMQPHAYPTAYQMHEAMVHEDQRQSRRKKSRSSSSSSERRRHD